jgi:hypothetical protein
MRKLFGRHSINLFLLVTCAMWSQSSTGQKTVDPEISGVIPCERQINEMMTALGMPTLNLPGWNFARQGRSYTRAGLNETIGGAGKIEKNMAEDIPRLEKTLDETETKFIELSKLHEDLSGQGELLALCLRDRDCPKSLMAKTKKNSDLEKKLTALARERETLQEKIRTLKNRPFDLTIIHGDFRDTEAEESKLNAAVNSLWDKKAKINSEITLRRDALKSINNSQDQSKDKELEAYSKKQQNKIARLEASLKEADNSIAKVSEELASIFKRKHNKTTVSYSRSENPTVTEYIRICHQNNCAIPQLDLKDCQWIGPVSSKSKKDPHISPAPTNLGEFCTGDRFGTLYPCSEVAKTTCSSDQYQNLPKPNQEQCVKRKFRKTEQQSPPPNGAQPATPAS